MTVMFAFAVLLSTSLSNPVVIVTLVGLLSLVLAPLLYSLNYYCAKRLIEDESVRPGRLYRLWALSGIVFMTGAAGLYPYTP